MTLHDHINQLLLELERQLKQIINEIYAEQEILISATIVPAMRAMYDEANDMYEYFIKKYYSKPTSKYIRHGTSSAGITYGHNLYYGNQIELIEGRVPEVSIEFSGSDMEDYKSKTADFVLDMVLRGYRGVPGKNGKRWSASYSGEFFSISNTTPDRAFKIFNEHFDEYFNEIFEEYLLSELSSGFYTWFRR